MIRVAFDLDNTVIDYSISCIEYCKRNDLPLSGDINHLRSQLRPHNSNQDSWVQAQSWIYGDGLRYAVLSVGAIEIFGLLKVRGIKAEIFSHKTEFTPPEFGSVPIRDLMKNWLHSSPLASVVSIERDIHFFETLGDKVDAISKASLNFYMDDLVKVFEYQGYPRNLESFIYRPTTLYPDWLKPINNFLELESIFQ